MVNDSTSEAKSQDYRVILPRKNLKVLVVLQVFDFQLRLLLLTHGVGERQNECVQVIFIADFDRELVWVLPV